MVVWSAQLEKNSRRTWAIPKAGSARPVRSDVNRILIIVGRKGLSAVSDYQWRWLMMVGNELLTQICWCRHFIYRSSNNSRRRIPLLMPVLNRSSPARSLFCPLVSAYNQASWSNRHSRGWGQALRRISSGREESAQFPGAHACVYREGCIRQQPCQPAKALYRKM